MLEFTRPDCVDADEWQALTTLHDRLERALRDTDAELVLGTAKDLCEAVAKVTYQQRSERVAPSADMPSLIAGAHRLVNRLPSESGAQGGAVRNLAGGAMKLANQLNEFRNQAGTGHGRPTPSSLDDVDARFAASAGLLWCSWVLTRLDALAANDPDRLARDIAAGELFFRGDLTRRLAAAGLATMDEQDQRVLGFAIGQRGGPMGTATVYSEGIAAALNTPSLDEWPATYRQAVAEGLVTDRNGYIRVSPNGIRAILRLVDPLSDHGASTVTAISALLDASALSYAVGDETRHQTVVALREAASQTRDRSLATALRALAQDLEPDI